jgi:hypothetical protein
VALGVGCPTHTKTQLGHFIFSRVSNCTPPTRRFFFLVERFGIPTIFFVVDLHIPPPNWCVTFDANQRKGRLTLKNGVGGDTNALWRPLPVPVFTRVGRPVTWCPPN